MDKKDRLAQARSKLKSYQEKKISLDAHKDLNFALISDDAPQFADEARFSDMITENVHLNDTIRTLTSQMFEMHDKVAALEMEKQQLQLDVESPSEEIRLEMYLAKEETRNVKAQLFASEKQLGESQQLNQMQQRTNARLEASISHLEQLILEKGVQERELLISQSVPEHNTSDFEVQLADRDEQIKNLTNQLHHLQEHDITTKSKLEHLKKYLAEEDLQIQASSDREALARQDLKAATKQMNDMSQNLEIVQSQNIELQESFKKTQLEHEQTVNSLQTEIKAYSDSLKSSNKNVQNIESLMDLNSKYQSDLETLTSRNNHLLAENKQLILHLEELRQLTVTLTNEKANLVTEIRHVKNNSYMFANELNAKGLTAGTHDTEDVTTLLELKSLNSEPIAPLQKDLQPTESNSHDGSLTTEIILNLQSEIRLLTSSLDASTQKNIQLKQSLVAEERRTILLAGIL